MWLPLKATRNHMCESPAPSDAHTHTRATWCHWSGAIEGKPKSKVQILKIKGLADGPSSPPPSLCLSLSLLPRQECFSLNSRLNQEPQMQIRVGVCCSKPLWAKQAKKKKKEGVQTLYVTLCLNRIVTECVVDLTRLHC